MLRNLIKSSPFLFFLWYHLWRKNRGVKIEYFNKQTVLYLDGYQRSGNTYSLHLIKTIWPSIKFIHHFHAIAPIKIALKKNLPVFILLRDPLNSISSRYLKELSFQGKEFDSRQIEISTL